MAEFAVTFSIGRDRTIHIPDPTWSNHVNVFRNAGLTPKPYRYYDPSSRSLDFPGFLSDLGSAPPGSLFMLHACAHNPTGCDPSREQWALVSEKVRQKGHVVFFDCAYQGFASGDPEADAFSLRKFVQDGHQIMLCQSFAKVTHH
jgi:aspartate/tyrosine/aromatic aminotransferase